jgi:hypothetical protein
VVVGTVAAVCGIAAVFSSQSTPSSVNLVSLQTGYSAEVEQAYVEYLAKYGKQFASRNDIPTSMEKFAKNYEIVKKHNAKTDRLYDMEMNLFADRSNEEVMNLKPSFDELAMVTPYMSVMQVQDSWDWSQTDKLIPV